MNEENLNDQDKLDVESVKKEIIKLMAYYGFTDYVEIEDEAANMLLMALTQDKIQSVRSNGEGGIVIEYSDDGMEIDER
jgi:hypothetical protein